MALAELFSADWLRVAADLTADLESASLDPEERSRLIDANRDTWASMKHALGKFNHHKCWYCESIDRRSDNVVDHYRPKKGGSSQPHNGYWWLSFDWSNLRFGCTFCNSRRAEIESGTVGGKADSFPLLDETTRAKMPDDDLSKEVPLILDPCRPSDCGAVWFDDSGTLQLNPALSPSDQPTMADKVAASRELLHLDHPELVAERRRVYRRVQTLMAAADKYFRALEGSPSEREMFETVLSELTEMVHESAEYSTAARCAVRGFRSKSGVAQAIVEQLF